MEIGNYDYKDFPLLENAVVYCDVPYENTAQYDAYFRHSEFWEWAREQAKNHLLFVSEYTAPDDFVPIWEKKKLCSMSATNNSKKTVEKLFVHKSQFKKLNLL